MAKEITSARENGVMGLRSRNAIGGSADRAHGRASYPSLSKGSYNARVTSGEDMDRKHGELGNSFVMPTYQFQADEYKAATGKSLPNDAVQVVFGRGAANGEDFRNVVSQSRYSHIKVLEASTRSGNKTYLSGYDSTREIRTLIDDVKKRQRNASAARTMRSFGRRKGTVNGF